VINGPSKSRAVGGPLALILFTVREESEVERYENQDDVSFHYEPFPKAVSKEREIYTTMTTASATA
jgi:hypothetical protein